MRVGNNFAWKIVPGKIYVKIRAPKTELKLDRNKH
jgi:hypothetical protein